MAIRIPAMANNVFISIALRAQSANEAEILSIDWAAVNAENE
jgi:hypothetical protein